MDRATKKGKQTNKQTERDIKIYQRNNIYNKRASKKIGEGKWNDEWWGQTREGEQKQRKKQQLQKYT